jgi:hypothetical protein
MRHKLRLLQRRPGFQAWHELPPIHGGGGGGVGCGFLGDLAQACAKTSGMPQKEDTRDEVAPGAQGSTLLLWFFGSVQRGLQVWGRWGWCVRGWAGGAGGPLTGFLLLLFMLSSPSPLWESVFRSLRWAAPWRGRAPLRTPCQRRRAPQECQPQGPTRPAPAGRSRRPPGAAATTWTGEPAGSSREAPASPAP